MKEASKDVKLMSQYSQDPHRKNRRNDIKPLRSIKMLDKVDLDLDSPRMRLAIDNLGIGINELQAR